MGTKHISHGPKRRRFWAVRDYPPGTRRPGVESAEHVVSSDSKESTDSAAGADSPRSAARLEPEKVRASDRQVGSSKGKSVAVGVPKSGKQRNAAVRSFSPGCGDSSYNKDEGDSLKRDLYATAGKSGDAKKPIKEIGDSNRKKPATAEKIPTEQTTNQMTRQEKDGDRKQFNTSLHGTCSRKGVAKTDAKNIGAKAASKGILEFARDVYEGKTMIPLDSNNDRFTSEKIVVGDKYMKAPSERVLVLGLMAAQNCPWTSKVKPNQKKPSVVPQSI